MDSLVVQQLRRERMISFKRLPILLGAAMMMASAAFAQTGTITVNGNTPEAFSLTNPAGGALSSTISLGVLTPANTGTVTSGTATVNMRSNKAYKVTAQSSALTITGGGATDGGDDIAPVSYTHLRAHETPEHLVCRLL